MTTFQILVTPLLGGLAAWSALRVARREAAVPGGVFWTAVWSAAAALVAFPGGTVVLARWLGIGRGADLVLYATTLGGFAAALYFHTRYQRLELMVTHLMRRETLREPRPPHSACTDTPGSSSLR
ncbi:MAG TPA: DUF2304 domain-containing protein [Vicinamibacterales bacterium]|nr:DUF2304 domain-containing protein [Vicinamibacterales bacterium]